MSWRNELFVGILRAERLFLGTENGGLGDEITFAEMDVINGVTPGVAAAGKAIVLDASADLLSGINDFTVDGVLTAEGNLVGEVEVHVGTFLRIGDDDVTRGQVAIYGAATGSTNGGVIYFHSAVDHDGTNDYFSLGVSSDEFILELANATDIINYSVSNNILALTAGTINLTGAVVATGAISSGTQDTVAGSFMGYGHATGSTIGGKIELQTAADHDTTIDSYSVRVVEDDLLIGPNNDTDALIFNGATGTFEFTGAAGVLMTGAVGLIVAQEITSQTGVIKCGVEDSVSGDFIAYGGTEGTGGEFRAHTSDADDAVIDYYVFRVVGKDLNIGPDTDSDALKYDGTANSWNFLNTGGVIVTNGITSELGSITAGVNDGTGAGLFTAYGQATTVGGGLRCFVQGDQDDTIDYYVFQASDDDLFIGPDTNTNALKYDGANDRWEFTVGAPVNIAGGWLIKGTAVDVTAAELNLLLYQAAAVVFNPGNGSGTGTNELTFNDAAGANMEIPTSGVMYFSSTDAGLDFLPITTSVVCSKGNVDKEGAVAGADLFHFVTDAEGELDFTITAAADDYFCVIVLPNGKLQISAVITVS
jgi:hypothetical protein